jgi:hypothetical protein
MLCPDPIACDCDPAECTGHGDHRGQDVGGNHGVPPAGIGVEPHGRSPVPQSGVPACENPHNHTVCDPEECRYEIPKGGDTLESLELTGAIHPVPMLTGAQLWGEHPGPERRFTDSLEKSEAFGPLIVDKSLLCLQTKI